MTRFGAAAIAALLISVPALAQQQLTSDGFAFLEAVRKQDGDKVSTLLEQPSSTIVNTRDRSTGDGALHIVARDRNRNWLLFMLGKGARPDLRNRDGTTALAIAAQIGWTEGVDLLLKRNATVDLANDRGETPLMLAVFQRDVPTIRLLLAAGADPRKTDNAAGYSALDYARRDTRAANIVPLLEEPAKKKAATFGPTF